MDEVAAKILQSKLEKQISDWSLQRLRLERQLKYMKSRMIIIGTLILVLEIVHMFVPQLVFPPYNSIVTLAFSVWFVVLVVKYSLGYRDKICTRSAEEIIRLAAEYNEAIKDVPNARHCDFLPPEVFQQKKRFTRKKHARAVVIQTANQAVSASAAVAQTAGQAVSVVAQTASQAATVSATVTQTAGQATTAPLLPSVEV